MEHQLHARPHLCFRLRSWADVEEDMEDVEVVSFVLLLSLHHIVVVHWEDANSTKSQWKTSFAMVVVVEPSCHTVQATINRTITTKALH